MGLHQAEMLLHSKISNHKMKRQPMEREKIFVNHISDKALIAKIYKELIQFNSKTKQKKQIIQSKIGRGPE